MKWQVESKVDNEEIDRFLRFYLPANIYDHCYIKIEFISFIFILFYLERE